MKYILLILGALMLSALHAEVVANIDWPHFLSRQDPFWEVLPESWNDGAFLGNGELGDMIYADRKQNGLIIHLGRSDVTDHRNEPKNLPPNLKGKRPDSQVWGSGHTETFRIDIGDLVLHPAGVIQSGTMRLDLWNAEARGTVVTNLGRVTDLGKTYRHEWVKQYRPLHICSERYCFTHQNGKDLPK